MILTVMSEEVDKRGGLTSAASCELTMIDRNKTGYNSSQEGSEMDDEGGTSS